MKWTDSDPKISATLPNGRVSRRHSSLLISALLRYSMKKRRHESDVTPVDKPVSRGGKPNTLENTRARETKGMCSRPVTREELTSIQIQLAVLSDTDGDRPIHIAVANENLKLVQKLCHLMMKNSISLDIANYLRQTPLHLAVILGNVELIQLLLKCGASPLICDRNGNSVLHLAVKSNSNRSVFDILLSHTQTKNILNAIDHEGYSALHYAVFQNDTSAVQILQTSGADINKIDGKSGRTGLIHAVLEQNLSMVELLLESGACPQKTDYSGQSAFEMSLQTGNASVIRLLEKRMPQNEEVVPKTSTQVTKRTKSSNFY